MPTKSRNCRNCKHFTPLSVEDSGLQSGWSYVIGECHETRSCHSGRKNLADWCKGCEYHRFMTRRLYAGRTLTATTPTRHTFTDLLALIAWPLFAALIAGEIIIISMLIGD